MSKDELSTPSGDAPSAAAAADTLLIREWTKRHGYTGRWIRFDVPFVLSGTWLARNHVCMSLKELERDEPRGLSAAEAPVERRVIPNPSPLPGEES